MIGLGPAYGWKRFEKVVQHGGESTKWIDEPRPGQLVIVARHDGSGSLEIDQMIYDGHAGWGHWVWWIHTP